MKFTFARVLLAVFLPSACGPGSPRDSTGSTESTGSVTTSSATPTTTMPTPDMGTEDPICPSLPPLAADGCLPITACPETTVFTGDVVIATPEDVAALACVHELRGDLDIYDLEVKHLTGLERLERVRGSIRITQNPGLTDLAGLCGLTAVETRMDGTGGDLAIDINGKMMDLTGLARLEQVAGELRIRDNSALASMRGLARLSSVGAELEVWGNSALESLRGLELLATVPAITVYGNNRLVDLCGLHGLTAVDSLDVVGNSGLQSLWGAHHLERATVVHIGRNDALVDLAGLQSLSDVPHLKVRGNAALQSLAGLDALVAVESLEVSGNDALLDWQAPANLLAVQHLEICGNDALTSLSAINLTVDRLTVIYNDVLGDAAGQSYAASLGVSTTKIARNSLPPYSDLSPCPWVGDGICDEEDACYEHSCVFCEHNDCCGDTTPTAMCAPDTDDPKDCPGSV